MANLIDKDALIQEIERRKKEEVNYDKNGEFASWAAHNHYSVLDSIQDFISTIALIDKDALIEEIERRKEEEVNYDKNGEFASWADHNRYSVLDSIQDFINTMEVKEVDLEKHLKEDIEDVFFDLNGVAVQGATHYLTVEDVKDIAKHFFGLGLKAAQKGE